MKRMFVASAAFRLSLPKHITSFRFLFNIRRDLFDQIIGTLGSVLIIMLSSIGFCVKAERQKIDDDGYRALSRKWK